MYAVNHPASKHGRPHREAHRHPLCETRTYGFLSVELRSSTVEGGKVEPQGALGLGFRPDVTVWSTWFPTGFLDPSQGQLCVFSFDSGQGSIGARLS